MSSTHERAPSEHSRTTRVLGLPSAVRVCLFDMDGVLTQTATLHAAAWKRAFDEYLRTHSPGADDQPFDAVSDYDDYVDGKLRVDGARAFLLSRGIHLPEGNESDSPGAETLNGIAKRKDEFFLRLLQKNGAKSYEGSVRYVRAVRTEGLRTAVVSSSKHCREVLDSAKLTDLFDGRIDGLVASAEHLAGKPSPDSYLAAARLLGAPPSEAAVFEDALSGVEAGRAGQFGFVVGVDRTGQGEELRRHGADAVVSDLAALLEDT